MKLLKINKLKGFESVEDRYYVIPELMQIVSLVSGENSVRRNRFVDWCEVEVHAKVNLRTFDRKNKSVSYSTLSKAILNFEKGEL